MSDLTPDPDARRPETDPTCVEPDLLRGGGFDMGSLLEQAMEMQQQLLEAPRPPRPRPSSRASRRRSGRRSGSPAAMVFESVTIAPDAVDPDDVELLQDLVLAALHDAIDQIGQLQQASMGGARPRRHGRRARAGHGRVRRRRRRRGRRADDEDPDDDPVDGVSTYAGTGAGPDRRAGSAARASGPKSAQRIAFHLLKVPTVDATRLARAITEAKERGDLLHALLQHRRGR